MNSGHLAPPDNLVLLASDHNGVELKSAVVHLLGQLGYHAIDLGPYENAAKVDYVDYARTLGHIIDAGQAPWGVLMCGTGTGMSMVANRFSKVRAALAHSEEVARKSREHNNANVLCLGAWVNSTEANLEIVKAWFEERFGEGRHVRRIEKLSPARTERIIFANGVFDLLHTGHIQLLNFARSLGSKLIVGINSDRATRLLKGPERPINHEDDRRAVLLNLDCVDEVIVFDDVSTTELILALQPDVIVKGAEFTADEVRQRDGIPNHIEVKICPLMMESQGHKYSTTRILEKAKARRDSQEK